MKIYQQWFARRVSEDPSAADPAIVAHKKSLFRPLKGTVLEIGCGTGINFSYFPKQITWTGLEPNPYMRQYMPQTLPVVSGVAEKIPFPNKHFDCVVATHVLCSVDDVGQVLAEVHRVLKPKGTFYFLEHVQSTYLLRRLLQQLITPVWRIMADGCHPNRDVLSLLQASGLFSKITYDAFQTSLPVVSDHISGKAIK